MPLSFTRAPTVAIGDRITSRQHNELAGAFNSRLVSGAGDPTWRAWWKAYAWMRELRGPDGNLTPGQDEWFEFYSNVPPGGDAELNPMNFDAPMPWFVFGRDDDTNAALDTPAEAVRLDVLETAADPTDPNFPRAVWELGKRQRGAFDPATGRQNAPAREVADYNHRFFSGWTLDTNLVPQPPSAGAYFQVNKFGTVWGGYFGHGDRMECPGDPGDPPQYRPGWSFIPLRQGLTARNYDLCAGTGILQYINMLGDRYRLEFSNGRTEDLLYTDFLLRPSSGYIGLQHHEDWAMSEFLQRFASDFRGSDAQRTGEWHIRSLGFDFEEFFRSQYPLAPALGRGVGPDEVEAVYPRFRITAPAQAGSLGVRIDAGGGGGTSFTVPAGFVLGGYYIQGQGLAGPARVELVDAATQEVLAQATVTGDHTGMEWLIEKAAGTVNLRVVDFLPQGTIEFELAVIESYRPNLLDAYVVLRRASTTGDGTGLDSTGPRFSGARALGHDFLRRGCILNDEAMGDPPPPEIQSNPVYETVRRTLRENLRFFKRGSFHSLGAEDGKAVLYFQRHLLGVDLWDGFAPPLTEIASGAIQDHVLYQVRGGSIQYHGRLYADGQEFEGVAGVKEFTIAGGAAQVFQIEGILTIAPEGGLTNEWLLFMSFNPYGPESHPLKPEGYGDVLPFLLNRCHLQSPYSAFSSGSILNRMADAGDGVLTPKVPGGWSYALGTNNAATPDFFASCKIYPPDYQVISVRMENGLVKVKLDRTLADGPPTQRQDYNALTDYLSSLGPGGVTCPQRAGDGAAGETLLPLPSGCCHPRFYFTRMVPRVRVDTPDNDTEEPEDTRLLYDRQCWMHWLLEAMAPGYLDPVASARSDSIESCGPGVDFSFTTLVHAATGGRWFSLFPGRVRPENHQGFGPYSMMIPRVEHFNLLSACINLLTSVRIMLPLEVQARFEVSSGIRPIGTAGCPPSVKYATVGDPSVNYRQWDGDPVNLPVLPGVGTFSDDTQYPLTGWYSSCNPIDHDGCGAAPRLVTCDWGSAIGLGSSLFGEGTGAAILIDGGCRFTTGGLSTIRTVDSCAHWSMDAGGHRVIGEAPGHSTQLVSGRSRCWVRTNPEHNAVAAVPPALRALMFDQTGGLRMFIIDLETWYTNTGPAPLGEDCGTTCADARPRQHSRQSYRCITAAGAPGDGIFSAEGIEILPRPLQPSMIFKYIVNNVGSCCEITHAPQSHALVLGAGHVIVVIPVVAPPPP